tara:strand:+ start:1068 stop:1292 length:225 start_codon:yes stop_codon:yes gene_type:complete
MNKENILSEGTLSYLFNLIRYGRKMNKSGKITSDDKKLLKNKNFIKALKDYEKFVKKADKERDQIIKKYNIKLR